MTINPCATNPTLWDSPAIPHGALVPAGYADRIRTALDGCAGCPILAACRVATDRNPPKHTCVCAGRLWHKGVAYDLDRWLAILPNMPDVPRECARRSCTARFVARRSDQRYCDRRCKHGAEYDRLCQRQLATTA